MLAANARYPNTAPQALAFQATKKTAPSPMSSASTKVTTSTNQLLASMLMNVVCSKNARPAIARSMKSCSCMSENVSIPSSGRNALAQKYVVNTPRNIPR